MLLLPNYSTIEENFVGLKLCATSTAFDFNPQMCENELATISYVVLIFDLVRCSYGCACVKIRLANVSPSFAHWI